MLRALILGSSFVAVPALAAVQSYDAVCPSSCAASDGTTQPQGTTLFRFQWDGQSSYVPTDAAGLPLNAIADPQQTTPVYQPVVASSLNFATSQAPITSFSFAGAKLTQQKADGTTSTQPTGSSITGTITHAGRTTTPTTTSFGALTAGTSKSIGVPAVDTVSGPAQINDECEVVLINGGFPPTGMSDPICAITSSGLATVQFPAIAAVAAGSLTYNVFWRG